MTVDGCKIRFASNGGRPRSSSQHTLQSPRCFVTHSAVIHSTAGHSSLPADADCESPSLPCPPAADSKAAAPLCIKPSLRFSVPQGTVAAVAATPPPSRLSPSPSYPSLLSANGMSSLLSLLLLSLDFRLFVYSFAADLQLG